jgi:ketosteroid isomerase-like protein
MEKAKAEIQALENAFAAGEMAKDADAVVVYYSDDAVSYSRNEEPAIGKPAIRERIAKRLAADTSGNKTVYTVVDMFAEGKHLVEVGSFLVTSPAGETTDKGYYMSYFQNRDGKYQCVRDMSVTSLPAK